MQSGKPSNQENNNAALGVEIKNNSCPKCCGERLTFCKCPKGGGDGGNSGSSTDDKNEKKGLGATEGSARVAFAKMSFEEFDQSPNGCRKLADSGKLEEAAIATTNYLSDVKGLNSFQKCLLHWHAGQSYAMCGKNDLAINNFNLAGEYTDEMTKIFGPAANSYYKATVAFLNKDTELVRQHLQQVLTIPICAYPHSNVVLIPGRINDMCEYPGISYGDIFKMKPTLPPLPGKSNWHEINAKDMNEEGKAVASYRDTLESILTVQQSQRSEHLLPKPGIISKPASTVQSFPLAKQNNSSSITSKMDVDSNELGDDSISQPKSLPSPFKAFKTRLTRE